ncbi:FKBP-type peptidyl-prolyl cis-trans isomerase [Portibacter marinus]|uniref:FKBP-type peptidyl-prolyl cis-trans isomerase n=1 Tax=Portibacter marinus TaxID=2898660 RepID=UPI001F4817DA|nr:FKBP-type peptidyl-prolyl cis-trans isomerase [Portibacter marinus]
MRFSLIIWAIGIVLMSSCNKDRRSEDEIIQDFISENNLVGEFMQDGIFVAIENPTNGAHPNDDDTVEVFYEGRYASDGEVFDGNLDEETIKFPLNRVIPGWRKGIPYFGVGDKGWLVLPADQAYGSSPPGNIRSDAAMAFYVELVSID